MMKDSVKNLVLLHVACAMATVVCYNDNDAYIPEQWAMEGLLILEESMVMSRLVHRDFSDEVQNFGDVVNTRRPNKFVSKRKNDDDEVTSQAAVSTNVRVPLDQHHYSSFVIKDGEGSKSFQDLLEIYLRPAIQAVGRGVDRSVIGQAHAFLGTPTRRIGQLGGLNSTTASDYIIQARQALTDSNVPEDGMRNFVMSPASEAQFLRTELFTAVDKSGSVDALRRASLGMLFDFNMYSARNTPATLVSQQDVATGTVTAAFAADAAPASRAVTLVGHVAVVGEYFTIGGNMQPQFITAVTASGGDTTAITPNEANKFASSAGAALTVYKRVSAAATYASGYSKEILVDGWTLAPAAGSMISFGTGASRRTYTVIESSLNSAGVQALLLDRPLELGIANDDPGFPLPAGSYNLAFHKNAIALVTRPLAIPNNRLGVMTAVQSYNELALRVTMQYDSKAQGTRVNVDLLSGVAILDPNMGVVVLG